MLSLAGVKEPESVRGREFQAGDLSGALIPWKNKGPIYLLVNQLTHRYCLPCFSDVDALRLFMIRAGVVDYEIKRIEVGSEFLKSFEGSNIKVVLNPENLPNCEVEIGHSGVPSDQWKLR